ncbi:hypothetical protein NPIL_319481 [Nephila pilipes]|uniref:Uncharacterized protein n=1 Tax=Nephila pilipes TaxID=299642 RepID=A0A8X6N2K3_NEPPI|nr:hypothetical protein NPIL_319481 [Nephila pilipes]
MVELAGVITASSVQRRSKTLLEFPSSTGHPFWGVVAQDKSQGKMQINYLFPSPSEEKKQQKQDGRRMTTVDARTEGHDPFQRFSK